MQTYCQHITITINSKLLLTCPINRAKTWRKQRCKAPYIHQAGRMLTSLAQMDNLTLGSKRVVAMLSQESLHKAMAPTSCIIQNRLNNLFRHTSDVTGPFHEPYARLFIDKSHALASRSRIFLVSLLADQKHSIRP